MGKHFTFAHFLAAIAHCAQRIFMDPGAISIQRFLEWMDASKGRVVFSAAFPGILAFGGGLRLAPERSAIVPLLPPPAAQEVQEPEQQQQPRQQPSMAQQQPRVEERRPPSQTQPLASHFPQEVDGCSHTMSSMRKLVTVPNPGASGARKKAMASTGAKMAAVRDLPRWARTLARQVFVHYTLLGDPLNRTHLSSLKFNRFLRDAGLLPCEASGNPWASGISSGKATPSPNGQRHFGDTLRRSAGSSSRTSSAPHGGRLERPQSAGALGRRPGSPSRKAPLPAWTPISPASSSSSPAGTGHSRRQFAVSDSPARLQQAAGDVDLGTSGLTNMAALPLTVFPEPPLTQVDVDLLFVQALRAQEKDSGAQPTTGTRSPNALLGRHINLGKVETMKNKGRHLSLDGFCRALADVAAKAMVGREETLKGDVLEDFCTLVLLPLAELFGDDECEDVALAAEVLAELETARVLQRCHHGMEKIFQVYAVECPHRRAYWSPDSFARFAHDFEITQEVNHLPLQKIFHDSVAHMKSTGTYAFSEGEMSLTALQLAIIVCSQKLQFPHHVTKPLERLVALFMRWNSLMAGSAGSRFGFPEPLLNVGKGAVANLARSSSSPSLAPNPSPRGGPRFGGWSAMMNEAAVAM